MGFDEAVSYNVAMEDSSEKQTSTARFATTHWSVVLVAAQEGTVQSSAALETLCSMY